MPAFTLTERMSPALPFGSVFWARVAHSVRTVVAHWVYTYKSRFSVLPLMAIPPLISRMCKYRDRFLFK